MLSDVGKKKSNKRITKSEMWTCGGGGGGESKKYTREKGLPVIMNTL